MTKNNPYIKILVNRLINALPYKIRRPRDIKRAILHNIIAEDNTLASRCFDEKECMKTYRTFERSDDFNDFIDWVHNAEQQYHLLKYYSKHDYESLDLLAEAFTADKYQEDIIDKVNIILYGGRD